MAQVSLAGEAQKSGASPEEAIALLAALSRLPGLRPVGLMTIPPLSDDPEASRPHFRALRQLLARAREETGLALPHLSMGMTADAEVAVEEGATMVRIGTAIFGAR
jgi:hypothetical protein